jgi:protein SCO1/2
MLLAAWFAWLPLAPPAMAHSGHEHRKAASDTVSPVKQPGKVADPAGDTAAHVVTVQQTAPATGGVMGLDEKPGAMVPLDLKFADRNGDSVTLGQCVNGPAVLSLLYYGCRDACGLLLTGIAQALRSYDDKPASAPNVVMISISENEGPADAAKAAEIADATLRHPYPEGKWRFLTGSADNIRKVTDAVGFHFVKRGNDYDHPLLLIILSPKGKVTRYITGTDFLPADLTLSLMEASNGTLQPTVARVLRSCFSYDPQSHRLVFKTLQVSATAILALLVAFIAFLIVASRSRRRKGNG